MQTLLQDIRYASCQLRKSCGLTVAVALTPAIGIGANTAGFSVMNAVLMQMLPQLRRIVAQTYPNVLLETPMKQQEQFERSYQQQRMFAVTGGFFGMLAAVLVAMRIHGTHAFRVSRRTTEIGVRMALGARRRQILAMVMRESLSILIAGLVIGVPLTYVTIQPLQSMLYQMSPFDPMSFVTAIIAVVMVASFAALLPARRAARLEPMQALRTE